LAKPAGAAACARTCGPAVAGPSGPRKERMRGPDQTRDLWRRFSPPVRAPQITALLPGGVAGAEPPADGVCRDIGAAAGEGLPLPENP
jgi:hypothetical protein